MTENFRKHYIATAAAALVAALPNGINTKPTSNTSRNRGTTAAEVARSFNMEYDDEPNRLETVPNPNANGRQWFKLLATNVVPAHLAGE